MNTFAMVTAILAASSALVGIGVWIGSVNSDRKNFREFMTHVRKRIDDIFDRLPNPLTNSSSPLSLTEMGREISVEIDARQWAARNLHDAKKATANKSPYETQQDCFDRAKMENLSGEEKRKVEDAAFNRGLTVSQILDVLAIELRDMLLSPNQLDNLP